MTQLETIMAWLQAGSINIFGRQFAGKDTQGRKLAQLFNAPLLGGGDILRQTIIPEHVKRIMEAGELVPINDYLNIVLPFLTQPKFSGKPLILSAVGRWHGEEEGVLRATEASGHPLKAVILIYFSEEAAWKRWEATRNAEDRSGRADEDAEALRVRLEEFKNKTLPVIDFYREKGLVIEIDGSAPKEQVTSMILKELADKARESAHTA